VQLPFGPYPVGNSLYPLALDLFIPTVFFFFFGATYRIGRYLITYQKPFTPYPTSSVREKISGGENVKELFTAISNSSIEGTKRKPVMTIAGLLMHVGLLLIILLLSQHMIFWAYYIPFYSVFFPFAIPVSSTDGWLAATYWTSPLTSTPNPFVNDIWGPLTIILNGQYLAYLLMIILAIYLAHKFIALAEGLTIRAGDWWFFVLIFLDVILGFLAASHIPSSVVWYDNILGAHILVAEIIIATLPFTRGFHMFEFWFGKLREWYYMVYRRGTK